MSIRLYRTAVPAFLLFILTSMMFNSPVGSSPPSELVYEPEQNYVITFVNYNPDLIDLNSISTDLPSIGDNKLYKMNYELQLANETYENLINNYIEDISQSSWTSSLDVDALTQQKANFARKSIFNQQNGTAIDAQLLENFLEQHPASTTLKDENRFYLYVFNLSRMDNQTEDHWFNVTEIDPDSGLQRFYWRLEWDYDLGNNYNVRFPYAAYSHSSEIALIDPTAFQWYLQWRKIWNKGVADHPFYNSDLDHLIQGLDNTIQKAETTYTISKWLDDWIRKIYNIKQGTVAPYPEELGSSVSVQLQVMYKGSETNKANLEWVVNEEVVSEQVTALLHASNTTVTTNYIDLESDSFMYNLYYSANKTYSVDGQAPPFEDWEYFDGVKHWSAIGDSRDLNNNYFDNQAADIVVKGLLYLVDNSSYFGNTGWTGGLYTGLGGGTGYMTMLYELDRAFMSDHTTRKAGLSRVLIHEIGHSVGIPHTFNNGGPSPDTFTSDFASDVMGYYPGTTKYSQLMLKLYHRKGADIEFNHIIDEYKDHLNDKSEITLEYVSELFSNAVKLHKSRKYIEAYFTLKTAQLALIQDTVNPTGSVVSTFSSLTSQLDGTSSLTSQLDETSGSTNSESKKKDSNGFQFRWLILPVAMFTIIKRKRSKLQ